MKRVAMILAMVLLAGASGCSTYQLRGKVIEGRTSGVMLVNKDDPRLTTPGLSGATIDVTLDPQRMGEKHLGQYQTDLDGNFAIPVSEIGAGMFEYDVELVGRHPGFKAAIHKMRLPSADRRVLIVLGEGKDTYRGPRDIIDESLRIGGEQSN